MKIKMTAIVKRQLARFNIYTKSKRIAKRFNIQKAGHFSKSKTIFVTFLYSKSHTLYATGFFKKFLKVAIIYKKHDNLRYVTFLYTKSQTFSKKQDNLLYVFIYKNTALWITRFFIEFLKFAEGGSPGGHLFILKTVHFL